MRGMAIAFFSLCMAGTAQASSLVYFGDAEPASTPSVVKVDEPEMSVTQEKVSAIPAPRGPMGETMVIRDGVVGSALPRHAAKPAAATSTQPATKVSAKTGKGATMRKPDTAR